MMGMTDARMKCEDREIKAMHVLANLDSLKEKSIIKYIKYVLHVGLNDWSTIARFVQGI